MVQLESAFFGGEGGWREVVGVGSNTWVIFEMVGAEIRVIVAVGLSRVSAQTKFDGDDVRCSDDLGSNMSILRLSFQLRRLSHHSN